MHGVFVVRFFPDFHICNAWMLSLPCESNEIIGTLKRCQKSTTLNIGISFMPNLLELRKEKCLIAVTQNLISKRNIPSVRLKAIFYLLFSTYMLKIG